MNKFINFKKILFSLFLLSLSFSPVFLMEDETVGSEPMDQIEIDQPGSIAIEREWERMVQEQELMMDRIAFKTLCYSTCFKSINQNSENWFNFYRRFKHKIDPYINEITLYLPLPPAMAPNHYCHNFEKMCSSIQRFSNLKQINLVNYPQKFHIDKLLRIFTQVNFFKLAKTSYSQMVDLRNTYPNVAFKYFHLH